MTPEAREKARASQRKWKAAHPDHNRTYYLQNRGKIRERQWEYDLMRCYGLTRQQYNEMLVAQGGVCRICTERSATKLSVDHDHSSGRIRALLCHQCNLAVAHVKENPARAIAAADYLIAHGKVAP